ncbi:myo inositol monophosphatase [Nannochloropsis gaditana]|uniref:inositol-phosphate phosphatase n=1 Tax=Nannochloropsis gaditana TaxID=72520 RepID=W7TL13_9STRA|nr:myo inositol monophosphatase [Nannochloropsis gaditana]
MGASIDERKPMVSGFGYASHSSSGIGSAHFRGRGRSHAPFKTWIWRHWPLLMVGSFGAFYLIHRLSHMGSSTSAPKVTSQSAQQLRSDSSRVQNGKVRLSDLIGASIHLSEVAAHEITDVKFGGKEATEVKGKTDEGVDEPVTLADARSNSVFVNGLRELFPGISILSEETDPDLEEVGISAINGVELTHDPWLDLKDILITVDPLDATKEFTENLLHFVTTMVCVVHKGKPIAGIINEPFVKDEAAVWGVALDKATEGADLRVSHGLQPSTEDTVAGADKVVISRSHTGSGADVVSEYLPGKQPVFAGGSGYKALRVLEGDANAYVHVTKIKSWDVCAADAVVHAAGGKFTNLKGERLVYEKDDPLISGGIIAAADSKMHAWYVEKLAPFLSSHGDKQRI